jgi:glycosyltransferase involved in cell wall biosynthesis
MSPKVTIITRTFGRRVANLRCTARSLLCQTYQPIEWLIVEDGTADAGAELATLDVRPGLTVRHVPIPKGGRSAAANAGLEAASGEFLGFLDDDDELFPTHVQTLSNLLQRHPSAAGAYAAALWSEFEDLGRDQRPIITSEKVFLVPTVSTFPILDQNLFPIQAVMFRARYVQKHRFDVNLDALEDWLFWTHLFLERKLVWTPEITSRFFVPAPTIRTKRDAAHAEARRYLKLQQNALCRERGLANLDLAGRNYACRLTQVFTAAIARDPARHCS